MRCTTPCSRSLGTTRNTIAIAATMNAPVAPGRMRSRQILEESSIRPLLLEYVVEGQPARGEEDDIESAEDQQPRADLGGRPADERTGGRARGRDQHGAEQRKGEERHQDGARARPGRDRGA